ncbi:MAG: ACT domain-containing protein [Ruminococcaceae bacterium]|nr:ACT domain-containing protein [Oscillospiraceae bacterium]
MASTPKYYIVEASALPEIFLKVAEAKHLLTTGQAATVNDAAKMTGISRSAFYKYRDSLLPFQNMTSGRIITFQLLLHDRPGTLQSLLSIFTEHNSNIITINSIVPTDGCAVVTISAETIHIDTNLEDLLQTLRDTPGVIKAEILAG